MNCPYCGANALKVTDTLADCETVVRRRFCTECKNEIFTLEYEDTAARDYYLKLCNVRNRERNLRRYKRDR